MTAWTCTACGGENAEGTRFCGHCGARRPEEWVCAACGGENPEGMRFCGNCGAPAAGTAAAATTSPAPSVATPPAPPTQPGEETAADMLRSFVATQVADRLVEAGGELPQERRLITALFADVSGFTTLADRLDPEQLLEVIDPVISVLSSVVGRYEGYVEKFAGDALLALFGAPVAHEDDAERALLVALEMHEELARVTAELGPDASGLTLHVGVNSGHGIARILGSEARMDYAVLGDSVILAQRLESAAPQGETYVSELTVRLTREAFEFEPVGELELKGKLEPVPAWRLVGRKTKAGAEAPRRLVARERELAVAEQALTALEEGRSAIISVTGEPGVGKSRLTAELRSRAVERANRWIETRCLSYGVGLAYWPYIELLRSVAGVDASAGDGAARAALARAPGMETAELPYFARLLDLAPPAEDELSTLEPEAFRRGLHEAFSTWLRRLAIERPVVFAIEDLHWADASSIALTEELARACAGTPLALYLIARPEGAEAVADIAAAAASSVRCELVLAPLDDDGVAALMRDMLGGEPPAELVFAVAGRTAGNPFFVEETVRSLTDRGDLVRQDEEWKLTATWDANTLPPTVEGLLASRIDLLPRQAASLLQTAAVVGRRMRVELLATVVDAPIDEPLDRVVAGGFLDRFDEDGLAGVAFHHALVQDVAYSRLLRKRRRNLHRRVAEVAESLYGSGDDVVDLLARHLYLAEAGAKAVDYLVRAGKRARTLYANDEAIVHLERAMEVAAGDESLAGRLPEIELALAELYELVGSYDEALELYARLRDATGDLRAWRGLASAHRRRGEYAESLDVVNRALASEELQGEDLAPLWLEAGWSLAVSGRYGEAIDVLAAGVTAAHERRDPAVAQLLVELARAEGVEGLYEEGLEHALAAQQIFEAEGDLAGLARTMRVLGDLYTKSKRFDDAARALRRGLELAERTGTVEEIGGCLINLALAEYNRGALDDAIAFQRRAIDQFERIGHASGRVIGYGNLAEMLVKAGAYEEAFAMAERTIALSREIGHPVTIADATDTIALLRMEQGRFLEAAERAEEAASLYSDLGAAPAAARSLELAARAWTEVGEPDRARRAEERARELVPA